jgi:Tol biopolymer transport system component
MNRSALFFPLLFLAVAACAKPHRPTTPTKHDPTAVPSRPQGKIAFSSLRGDKANIYVMNADGTHQTSLTNGKFDNSPCLSSDGRKIMWVALPFGHSEAYIMNADGTKANFLAVNVDMSTPTQVSFSPDGKQIVYTSDENGNQEVYVVNADGTQKTRLTKDGGYTDDIPHYYHPNSYSPRFSPDGQRIVFVSNRFFANSVLSEKICVMNADGTNQTLLMDSKDNRDIPSFSPDGKHIVFTTVHGNRDEGKSESQIYIMNADGTNPIRLTKTNDNSPCFSPDGKYIAYSSISPNTYQSSIYVMNADGTNPVRLTTGPFDASPSWSLGFVPAPPKATSPRHTHQ